MGARNRHRIAETERVEIAEISDVLDVIDFIDRDDHGFIGLVEEFRHRFIIAVRPFLPSTMKTMTSASSIAIPTWARIWVWKGLFFDFDAAGIDHAESLGEPGRGAVNTVAGDPRSIFNNGFPFADKAIENRRFANVRRPDEGDKA
jgi:hypothetical protein